MKEETKRLLDDAAKIIGYKDWQDVYDCLGEKQFKQTQGSQVEVIIEDAIEAAKPKWISVEERLPAHGKHILGIHEYLSWAIENGKRIDFKKRKVVTCFLAKEKTVSIECEDGDFEGVDVDENGVAYLKEGWYEICEQANADADYMYMPRSITHWQPLPTDNP